MKSFLEQAFGRADVTGPAMHAAIREWFDLYFGRAAPGEDPSGRLPVLIVDKLCRAVFAEYETRLTGADWMQENLRALNAVRRRALQSALVGGECLLKPVLCGGGFDFVPVRRDCFAPLARDAHGRLQAVGTMELLARGGRRYALLERRSAGAQGLCIETRLFELAGEALGHEAPLSALPETEALRPTLLLPGVPGVGLATLRTPLLNCVDGGPEAVAVFAPAVGLIHSLGRTEHQLRREFENGASGMLIAARCSGQWEETIELHGNNRSAFIKMPDSVTVTDAEEQHKTAMTPLAMGWAKSEDKLGFTNAIRHFLDCVRDGKTPLTDAADAYKTHELLDRILRAAGLPAMD